MKIKNYLLKNWKKIVFFILACISFFLTDKYIVKASETDYWGESTNPYTSIYINDCNGIDCRSSSSGTSQTIGSDLVQYYGADTYRTIYFNTNYLSIATNYGIMSSVFVGAMSPDFVYLLNQYYCSTANFSWSTIKSNIYLADNVTNAFSRSSKNVNSVETNVSSIGNQPFFQGAFTSCVVVSSIFNPSSTKQWVGTDFISKSDTITNVRLYPIGYTLESLGNANNLTSSDISNVINNSGLATATDIDEVNTSINNVKKEITTMQEEQQLTNEKLDQTNQELSDMNDNITNSDSSDATNEAGNFFSGFETDTFGLTSIITAPLDLIGSITSSSCSPLPLTLPFVDKSFNLPCMTTIYEEHFGSFLTIYQTITFGIVAYWVCVRIFALVKDFKNPDHDEIEVLDL